MLLPAPGLLSTTNDWPNSAVSSLAMMRATTSVVPPAEKPTTTRTGRSGYFLGSAAWAVSGASTLVPNKAAASTVRRDAAKPNERAARENRLIFVS